MRGYTEGEDYILEKEVWASKLCRNYLLKVAKEIYSKPHIKKTKEGYLVSGILKEEIKQSIDDVPNFVIDANIKEEILMAKFPAGRYSSEYMGDALVFFNMIKELEELLERYF